MKDPSYYKKRRRFHRTKAIELLGGSCSKCGSKNRLEFDHIIPASKTYQIGEILHYAWPVIEAELKKCQLLCNKHHTIKSIFDRGQQQAKHGTTTMYRQGCRCTSCRNTNNKYQREYKKRRRA